MFSRFFWFFFKKTWKRADIPLPLAPLSGCTALYLVFYRREGDMVLHCEEPYEANHDESDERHPCHAEVEQCQSPVDEATCDTCRGIDFLLKDDGQVVKEHVSHHAACRSGYTSHDDGDPERVATADGLLYAGDGEECQAERVEHKPCVVEPFEVARKHYGEDESQHGGSHIL